MRADPNVVAASSLPVQRVQVQRQGALGQRRMVLAVLAVVFVVDQLTKWWGWRHSSVAVINDGGSPFVDAALGRWYQDRVTGALLDLLAVGLLGSCVSVLTRRSRSALVLMPGALMIGGWSSNLFDRLGMHHWSAPGSARGAVDFIHLGHITWNVADFFILGGTSLFLLVSCRGLFATKGRDTERFRVVDDTASSAFGGVRRSAFATAIGLTFLVGVNAAASGGVTAPDHLGANLPSSAS